MRISDERIETGGNSLDWCYVMLMCHEGRPERSTSRVKSVCNVVKKNEDGGLLGYWGNDRPE